MISGTTSFVRYIGNGATTAFGLNAKIFAATDLLIALIDTNGNVYSFTFQSGSTFNNVTLGLTATVSDIDVDSGCTVTFSGPPTTGWTVDIRTVTPDTQLTSIKNQGAFLPELHEEAFDNLTRQVQDLRRQAYTFGIHGPDIEGTVWPALPNAVARANTQLVFDSNGLPTVGVPVTGVITQALIAALLSGSTFIGSVNAAAPILLRQSYNYSGGTAGFVVPVLNVRADVTNCGLNYPWAGLFNMHNTSTGTAQAVALYAQASKDVFNASPTWAAVFDLRETVPINGPGTGSVTVEIDHSANGTDTANGNRVGVDLVIRKFDTLNPIGNSCTWGYRVGAGVSDGGQSTVGYGYAFTPGSFATVGFSTAHATIATASFMCAQGQGIIWDGPTSNTIATAYDGIGIFFRTSGTKQARIKASDGSYWIQSGGNLVQVLSVPIAGYGTPTNGAHQASFNATTITLPNLAAAVAQMIVDLKTHGMIAF